MCSNKTRTIAATLTVAPQNPQSTTVANTTSPTHPSIRPTGPRPHLRPQLVQCNQTFTLRSRQLHTTDTTATSATCATSTNTTTTRPHLLRITTTHNNNEHRSYRSYCEHGYCSSLLHLQRRRRRLVMLVLHLALLLRRRQPVRKRSHQQIRSWDDGVGYCCFGSDDQRADITITKMSITTNTTTTCTTTKVLSLPI